LTVSDIKESLYFYTKILQFKVEYDRPETKFAFLSFQGSQIMIDGNNSHPDSPWYTGPLKYPGGRGIHFQFEVDKIMPIIKRLKKHGWPIKQSQKVFKYRQGDTLLRFRGFLVMDPDGYLLMFNEDLPSKKIQNPLAP